MSHDPIEYAKSRFDNVTQGSKPDTWTALARCHDDHENSVEITRGDDGRALIICRVCNDNAKTFEAHGIEAKKLFAQSNGRAKTNGHAKKKPEFKTVAKYTYCDEDGCYLYDVARREAIVDGEKKKDFPQSHTRPDGTWVGNIDGIRRVLFHLPRLMKAHPSRPAFLVEGEKDVLNLERVEVLASTNPGGAEKWLPEYSESLRGRPVMIVRDNDDSGTRHVQQVARMLYGIASEIRIIELPGVPHKGDISDWLLANGLMDERPINPDDIARIKKALRELIDAAPVWRPSDEDLKSIEAAKAKAAEDSQNETSEQRAGVEEHDDDPHRLARLFFGMHSRLEGLYHYRSEFYLWEKPRAAYRTLGKDEIKGRLVAFVKDEFDDLAEKQAEAEAKKEKGGKTIHPKKVTTDLLNNVLMALRSISQLPDYIDAPFWIRWEDGRWAEAAGPFPARECLVMPNGILHLPSFNRGENHRVEPTPKLFTTNALTFSYEPDATCQRWMKFLEEIWPLDYQQHDCLAELAWYLLTPRTEQQKMFMFIGTRRSGKGTIGSVLSALIGEHNAATPTLGDLAGPFGLQGLLGKTLAVVGDCRVGSNPDTNARIVERLLSITGGDRQDIARKGLSTIAGARLPVRFLILSNEVPSLGDASVTLPSRAIIFKMSTSFYGCEDTKLIDQLLRELPGILNWALAAGRRFEDRGRFDQPEAGQELVQMSEELSSPVANFVEDYLVRDPEKNITRPRLEELWAEWSRKRDKNKKPKPIWFVIRDLQSLVPNFRAERPRDEEQGGKQIKRYSGIGENLGKTAERMALDKMDKQQPEPPE